VRDFEESAVVVAGQKPGTDRVRVFEVGPGTGFFERNFERLYPVGAMFRR
jgi:hypothetical protein